MAANNMVRLKEYLQSNFHVNDREWGVTQQHVKLQRIPGGEFFLREGNICRQLAFIVEGVMRYLRFEEMGDETTCYFVSENDFVGDPESFATQKPSDKNLFAVTDCMLATISYEAWQRLSKTLPRFPEISAAINQKTMMDLLAQRDFLLNKDAAARYLYFIEHYPYILQRTPLGYIASYLGMTQQSLSRLRGQLS